MAEGYAVARGSGIDRLDPHRTVGPVVDEEREVTGGVARGFEYPQAAKVRPVRNGNECEVGLVGTVRVNFACGAAAWIASKPPTPPEAFLAAVIASRRERDLSRLRRESDLRQRLTARR